MLTSQDLFTFVLNLGKRAGWMMGGCLWCAGCAEVPLLLFWRRGGPRPTEQMVEAKKAELLAVLKEAGVKVDASASPQLLQ